MGDENANFLHFREIFAECDPLFASQLQGINPQYKPKKKSKTYEHQPNTFQSNI